MNSEEDLSDGEINFGSFDFSDYIKDMQEVEKLEKMDENYKHQCQYHLMLTGELNK
jgi:hypothetical protein